MAVLAALAALLFAQEAKHPWAGFREGSTVTYDVVVRERSVESTTMRRLTVTKVEGGKATLKEEDLDSEGKVTGTRERTVATAETGTSWSEKAKEEVSVGGRKIMCRVLESKEGSTWRKRWLSAESSTGLVQEVTQYESAGTKVKTTTKLAKLGEVVELGVKVTCAVFETVEEIGERTVKRTEWLSPEVPGHLVKSEKADGELTTIWEVSGFRRK